MHGVSAENPLKSVLSSPPRNGHDGQGIDRMLHAIRCHLGMDVAFVSEFRGPVRVFNHVDADGKSPIHVGDVIPLEDGYCQRVVDGRLPELMADTAAVPAAMALPDTRAVPIGSHLSVPIRLRDGRVFGTFCCFGFSKNTSLNERDLNMMRAFAELAAYQIEEEVDRDQLRRRAGAQRQAPPPGRPVRTGRGSIGCLACPLRSRG